jgi:tryptophan-rich hypothetical protein
MCKSPKLMPDGSLVGCRKCSQCKHLWTMDWAGRCIAESKTANYSYFVLLTYGRDEYGDSGHIRAAVLTYSDVQLYLKKLREKIGKLKYFVVGEYGGRNGRTHWHMVLFTENPIKNEISWGELHNDETWTQGWMSIQPFKWQDGPYACKYIHKDVKDNIAASMYNMSKKPPIGHEWFQRLAERYVEQGIAPQDMKYSFPDIRMKDGKSYQFIMSRKTAANFCRHFVEKWQEKYGKSEMDYNDVRFGNWQGQQPGVTRIPASPVIEEYLDKRMAEWVEKAEFWKEYWETHKQRQQKEIEYEQAWQEIVEFYKAHARPGTYIEPEKPPVRLVNAVQARLNRVRQAEAQAVRVK